MNKKDELRKIYGDIRANIKDREKKDCLIKEKVLKLFESSGADSIFIYVSIGSEADTKSIIKDLYPKVDIYIPITTDGIITPVLYRGESLIANRFGNINLSDKPVGMPPETKCFTVVPMLAFDDKCGRLGYGKGCYDRYLKDSDSFCVGIAYDEQLVDNLVSETHDIPLDLILTPQKTYRRN